MTICIAAIATINDRKIVVGASDRMITSGDIEFAPPQSKVFPLTNSINALVAGDSSVQIQLCNRTYGEVRRRIADDPKRWMPVADVADIFSREVAQHRAHVNERQFLEPLNLDFKKLTKRHRDLSPQWLKSMTDTMSNWELDLFTIITGQDNDGAHIYVVDGFGQIACHDAIGFAAIGVGRWHAESQFMFAEHTPWATFPETLLLTYVAKKRAEVAPGVGPTTDMFLIPVVGTPTQNLGTSEIQKLDEFYQAMRFEEETARATANTKCIEYLAGVVKAAAQAEPASQTIETPPTSENKPT